MATAMKTYRRRWEASEQALADNAELPRTEFALTRGGVDFLQLSIQLRAWKSPQQQATPLCLSGDVFICSTDAVMLISILMLIIHSLSLQLLLTSCAR